MFDVIVYASRKDFDVEEGQIDKQEFPTYRAMMFAAYNLLGSHYWVKVYKDNEFMFELLPE